MGFLGTSWVLNTMAPRNRYQVQFFRLQKLNRKIAYCSIRSTYVMFARAFGIFCCFCFSTAAAAVAVAAACFCCGCLCCCCCCCCCCYCTTYCWLVLLGVFFSFLPTLLRKLHGDGCCCTCLLYTSPSPRD